MSPLGHALANGDEAIAACLLAHPRIEVNSTYPDGRTDLMKAIADGYTDETCLLLLSHPGIKVNLVDHDKQTVLIMATRKHRKNMVKLILAHPGIDVNWADKRGSTALIWATEVLDKEVFELLLAHVQINVNSVNAVGHSALSIAVGSGYSDGAVELSPTPIWTDDLLASCRRARALHSAKDLQTGSWPGALVAQTPDYSKLARGRSIWWRTRDMVRLLLAHPKIQIGLYVNVREGAAKRFGGKLPGWYTLLMLEMCWE
ncbi:ankyrin repeat-containing domain protein [Coprinopsis sp. MPI-PUGE-AT-0042]|nr:ankyrin repeat-containing domain protein [Coprinopsis sp. MPI-PUGE-AT-0042]